MTALFCLLLGVRSSHADTLLVFGDSLSAGYGLAKQEAWPSLLQSRLAELGYRYQVVNASVSGETSAGGRSRFAAALKQHQPSIVILELGANDGLRGLPVSAMEDNLSAMIQASQAAGAKVLLLGMRMPPNLGPAYTQAFVETYPKLAKRHKVRLMPFLFEGFAGKPEAFLPDGLHPNAASQRIILDGVWPELKPLLRKS